jgi:hypothetical protein
MSTATARLMFLAAVLAGMVCGTCPAQAEKGFFDSLVPDVQGFEVVNEGPFDVNGNGTKETYSVLYQKGTDEEAMSLAKGQDGPIYGWSKWNKKYDKNNTAHNYTIIKTTPDGHFDLRLKTSDIIPVPRWVE